MDASVREDYLSVTLHATGSHGWTMTRLYLPGVLGMGELSPGNAVYLSGDVSVDDEVVVDGTATGCTGPELYEFDDDDAVIALSVDVDGNLVLGVAAEFRNGSVLDGAFVFE